MTTGLKLAGYRTISASALRQTEYVGRSLSSLEPVPSVWPFGGVYPLQTIEGRRRVLAVELISQHLPGLTGGGRSAEDVRMLAPMSHWLGDVSSPDWLAGLLSSRGVPFGALVFAPWYVDHRVAELHLVWRRPNDVTSSEDEVLVGLTYRTLALRAARAGYLGVVATTQNARLEALLAREFKTFDDDPEAVLR